MGKQIRSTEGEKKEKMTERTLILALTSGTSDESVKK
jgi:hypothetical protein